ncbi:spore germination protein [Paenibacillus baekrokdamisoli]|uniref:Spore germination protein n=1 Tax=Paenibacillus baekrokdamisoli TaxID=1712516 RepID=A0A3G9IW77_9BACL|nr:spore germination protein [Paenibacillus baekrokdamisoli]MBB3068190.1 spore germination protein KA [Paenibacillus baekrokdamisoli]BBH22766.1 spore germination protein [Paenibacillus baekrokdamisoli]
MFLLNWLKKRKGYQTAPSSRSNLFRPHSDSMQLHGKGLGKIEQQLELLQKHLVNSSDVVYHRFNAGPQLACAVVYIKGMIDQKAMQLSVLNVLHAFDHSLPANEFVKNFFDNKALPIAQQNVHHSIEGALRTILNGNVVLLIDGEVRMLQLSLVSFEKRAIDEAPNEAVIRGPREAFIENLETNISLLRRRLKTPSLKIEMLQLGRLTCTSVAIAYLHGTCKPQLLDDVKKRLLQIDIDAILGSSYVEEQIEDNPYSPFPQLQSTERPDVVCAALLEGRVAIMVDGDPIAIIAPTTLFMLMQAAEDYYQRYIAASWIRLVRFLFLFVSLLLPSVYVAITTFHPDMIPDNLLITVASSREAVPFPALVEAFMMEISFEALREATIRIPKAVGQSVSIIGALIIGTAAVEAGIASAAMVIIVSVTGIASFIIPHFGLGLAFRLLRFPIMIMAGLFGLFGIACAIILLYLHLVELRSFGTPYLTPLTPLKPSDLKDTFIRAPWWAIKTRPSFSGATKRRQAAEPRKWSQTPEEGGD